MASLAWLICQSKVGLGWIPIWQYMFKTYRYITCFKHVLNESHDRGSNSCCEILWNTSKPLDFIQHLISAHISPYYVMYSHENCIPNYILFFYNIKHLHRTLEFFWPVAGIHSQRYFKKFLSFLAQLLCHYISTIFERKKMLELCEISKIPELGQVHW